MGSTRRSGCRETQGEGFEDSSPASPASGDDRVGIPPWLPTRRRGAGRVDPLPPAAPPRHSYARLNSRPSKRSMSSSSAAIAFFSRRAEAPEREQLGAQAPAGPAEPPGAAPPAADGDGRPQDAAAGVDLGPLGAGGDELAVAVAHQVGVVGGQQADQPGGDRPRRAALRLPGRAARDALPRSSPAMALIPARMSRRGSPGPAGEVSLGGRAEARRSSGGRARRGRRSRSASLRAGIQSPASTSWVEPPSPAPRWARPVLTTSGKMWTRRLESMRRPPAWRRSESSVRVSGPSRSRALRISESARSWPAASTPKSARRRRLKAVMQRGEQRSDPREVVGRDQVRRVSHRPEPDDRALLRARGLDVREGELGVAGPDREPAGGELLGLSACRSAQDVGGVAAGGWAGAEAGALRARGRASPARRRDGGRATAARRAHLRLPPGGGPGPRAR